MKILLYALLVLIIYLGYSFLNFYKKYQVSKALIGATAPFEITGNNHTKTLLILGDSTGVGVGASHPEESVGGRLAKSINATYVENHAVSGALVRDLFPQLEKIQLPKYDVILIQIGGNDIVRFHDAHVGAAILGEILSKLPKSARTIVLSCGDVGTATIVPHVLRGFYTERTLMYHSAFNVVVTEHKGYYVNLYTEKVNDPFYLHPEIYLAKDEFHPSGEGYGLWFSKIKNLAQ